MAKETRVLIFVIVILCAWILFSGYSKNVAGEPARDGGPSPISADVSFSGESNVMYFLDRANAKIYRYNTQGRLTRSYTIDELGKDLISR